MNTVVQDPNTQRRSHIDQPHQHFFQSPHKVTIAMFIAAAAGWPLAADKVQTLSCCQLALLELLLGERSNISGRFPLAVGCWCASLLWGQHSKDIWRAVLDNAVHGPAIGEI